jgi:hypothetical protein
MSPTLPTLDLKLLERRPEESELDWWLFCQWLHMALDASGLPQVRRKSVLAGLVPGTSLDALEALATRHEWDRRVRVWDAVIAREALKRTAESLELMRDRQIALALQLQRLGGVEMTKLEERAANSDLSALAPKEVVKLIETGVKIERLVRGESTENVANVSKPDYSKLSDDELEAFRALCIKMGMDIS